LQLAQSLQFCDVCIADRDVIGACFGIATSVYLFSGIMEDLEESSLLLPKTDTKVKRDNRELSRRVFDAFQTAKKRRHLLFAILGFCVFVTVILVLLLTPIGCILSSFITNRFESMEHFVADKVFGVDYYRYAVTDTTNSSLSSLNITDNTLRIVLLGDSLINKPYEQHDLGGKIQAYLSQYPYTLEITNCGFNGHTIRAIGETPLTDCALPLNPHAVILFWDSDCSNVQEYDMTDSQVTILRSYYKSNVTSVVDTLVQTGTYSIEVQYSSIFPNRIVLSRATIS
jgi:hypothetical protein